MVVTTLSAENIIKVLVEYFERIEVSISNSRFSCMDTTNVNSGEKKGLKRLLQLEVPLLVWIGCANHKLAHCFKHLIGEYTNINNADATLLALWKYFHYCPLALNFLKEAADAYKEHVIVPVCRSVTRWTAHGRACEAVYDD